MNDNDSNVPFVESIHERLDKYDRLKRMATWVGGGLVALAALMTTDILKGETLFKKLVVTGIVLGGVLVGHSRQKSDWGETQLRRELRRNSDLEETHSVPETHQSFLEETIKSWKWALAGAVITGVIFLLGIWWSEFSSLWVRIAMFLSD